MANTPNSSIIECPQCHKPLINIGSKVERIHPVAKFIENHGFRTTGIASASLLILLIIFIDTLGLKRSAGYGGVALIFVPSIVMYFLKRAYPLYRVTDCPYCGYHAKQKLGHSSS